MASRAAKQKELKAIYDGSGKDLITLGTDHPSWGEWLSPFQAHREMHAMTRAGLPAAAALRAGTINAARALNVADRLGSIEPGKFADLFVVTGNPLADIRTTHNIRLVMKGGKVYDPKALLESVKGKLGPKDADEGEALVTIGHQEFGITAFLAILALVGACAGTTRSDTEPAVRAGERFEGQQIVLITGSTDGLGREVARKLAATGAHIIVHGRNRERGTALVEEITREGKGSAAFYAADFASLEQVRKLGDAILRDYDRLDVLINNAGILATTGGRQLSADGHELHFAVNYLAGFLLTRMLLPRIEQSAAARIVNVASVAQTPIEFDDVMLERNYNSSRAYGQSKLAQVLFTFDLARELEGKKVVVNALHPATLMPTQMVIGAGMRPRSTVEEGVEAVLQLVTAPGIGSGQYFSGLRATRANAQAYDEAAREKLRTLSRQLTARPG